MFTQSQAAAACLIIALTGILSASAQEGAQKPKLRVFLLTGQSNMEGKAKLSLLEYQAAQPETQETFAHLKDGESWKKREDVWIKFLDRKGPLTVGYGSPKCIGPELEFGNVLGDAFDEPVLLIKTAWGGKSLWRDFRPPSSGLPTEEALQPLLENQRKRNPERTMDEVKQDFGKFYRLMIEHTEGTLANVGEHFPQLKDHEPELSGIVWFQGWNDMINPQYTAEYAANMANFIRDVRRDLGTPELPFVIGVMGVDGKSPNPKQLEFREAQAAPATLPEFKDNVAVVQTGNWWDEKAHAVFKKGWREHLEEWNTVGSDYPFHYLGSAKTMLGIGNGFAEAMLGLMRKEKEE